MLEVKGLRQHRTKNMNCTNFSYVAELTDKFSIHEVKRLLGLSFGKLDFETRLQTLESSLNFGLKAPN